MTDELDARLRSALGDLELPRAPMSLMSSLAQLEVDAIAGRAPRVQRRSWFFLLSGLALVVVVAVVQVALLTAGPATSGPVPPTSAAPSPSAEPTSFPTGAFSAPGIAFEIPDGWTNQTSQLEQPTIQGTRYVGMLASGMTLCPIRPYSTAPPTPRPTGCSDQANLPGSASLAILEYTHQFPFAQWNGKPVPNSRYPTWGPVSDASPTWLITAPDDGVYVLSLSAPESELHSRIPQISSMVKTIQLSAWEPAPDVVDGRIHVDTQLGFSFDYPAGWGIYYPQDISMMDAAVVTVASGPLNPCDGHSCQRFTTPKETVAIEFRIGNGPTAPDWSNAPTTLGGAPAFRDDWGPRNATRADEGHSWSVRLADPSVLGIYVSLRGPGLPALRSAMQDVLDSVRIGP